MSCLGTLVVATESFFMYSGEVRVHWDPEAQVWWAESDDVPGLVAEAATEKDMKTELRQLVPELLIENNVDVPG